MEALTGMVEEEADGKFGWWEEDGVVGAEEGVWPTLTKLSLRLRVTKEGGGLKSAWKSRAIGSRRRCARVEMGKRGEQNKSKCGI